MQAFVATAEAVSSTNTYDNISTQKRGPRGEYLNKNIPKDPSERKLIHIIGPSEYWNLVLQSQSRRTSRHIFVGHKLSNLDDDFVDCLYQCFLDRYQYEETVDPKKA
nr:GRAS protein [Tanacetum cinerariifolium]